MTVEAQLIGVGTIPDDGISGMKIFSHSSGGNLLFPLMSEMESRREEFLFLYYCLFLIARGSNGI